MSTVLLQWLRQRRPENPRRVRRFREQVQALKWEQSNVAQSLFKLFDAVDVLAEAEVRYYYRRRGTRAWLSGVCRTLAWIFGTIGVLLPLCTAARGTAVESWGPWGYLFLALGGSFLGANALFGGTSGHVRFVSAQIELEKLITTSRIGWCRYLAHIDVEKISDEDIKRGFALVKTYAENLYSTTLSATRYWGETLMKELEKYRKSKERQAQRSS